jgi:hypothetical protein
MAAFLIILSGYVEAQLRALSVELLNLYADSENQTFHSYNTDLDIFDSHEIRTEMNAGTNNEVNKTVAARLRVIAKAHMTNIELLGQVQNIFRGAFAFEFVILSIGLIAELLGGLQNTYMQVPFAIIQVGMDCLVGQRLMDACNVFEVAVYSCKWERFNATNMKTVLLMLMNSQKTMTLSAGGIRVLNFACLMSVFKSIYSAFTTLQSVV